MAIRKALIVSAQAVIVIAAGCYGAVRYMTTAPDSLFEAAQLSFSREDVLLRDRLKDHIATISASERNIAHYDGLERTAQYLEATLQGFGHTLGRQTYAVHGKQVRNIDAVIEAESAEASPETLVLGAHYDSAVGSPGANANATGTAAVLELSGRLGDLKDRCRKRVRFAFFAAKEPPHFQTADMGSLRYAKALAARGERVAAMYSLDSLGYYSNARGSQRYAPLLDLVLPDRGDFVAFIGLIGSRPLAVKSLQLFRSYTQFPSFMGVGPALVPGTANSDHWAFAQQGFPAILVTDTAELRYPHHHRPTDTPDKVDIAKLTRVVKTIEDIIRESAQCRAKA
jgi:Peptidase family M28